MIIDHHNKMIFLHIPKCAGSTVRRKLEQSPGKELFTNDVRLVNGRYIDFTHLPYKYWETYLPELYHATRDYSFVAILRNPKTRFRSSFSQLRKKLNKSGLILNDSELKKYFHAKQDKILTDDLDSMFIHFQPQKKFIEGVPNLKLLLMEDQKSVHDYFHSAWNVDIDFSIKKNTARNFKFNRAMKLARFLGFRDLKFLGSALQKKARTLLYSEIEYLSPDELVNEFEEFYLNFYYDDLRLYQILKASADAS